MTEAVATDKGRASSALKKTKGKAQAVQNIPTESNNAAHAEVRAIRFWFFRLKRTSGRAKRLLSRFRVQKNQKTRIFRMRFMTFQGLATKIQVRKFSRENLSRPRYGVLLQRQVLHAHARIQESPVWFQRCNQSRTESTRLLKPGMVLLIFRSVQSATRLIRRSVDSLRYWLEQRRDQGTLLLQRNHQCQFAEIQRGAKWFRKCS